MTVLFDRRCSVLIGKPPADNFVLELPEVLKIEGLRVTFKIERDDKPQPNTLELTITNLSQDHRAQLEGKGFRIVVNAGYGDQVAQIYSGDMRTSTSRKMGTDWVTRILAGDGERAHQHARVNNSYKPGVKVADVVQGTIKALQQDPGTALAKAQQLAGEFSSGYVQSSKASTELTSLLEPYGWGWSIQDGRIELLAPGEALPGEGPLLSPETGLIGAPELSAPDKKSGKGTLKARSLLQPSLRPGQRFQLKSQSRSGTYKAKKVTHTGDTAGGDWFTDVEVEIA